MDTLFENLFHMPNDVIFASDLPTAISTGQAQESSETVIERDILQTAPLSIIGDYLSPYSQQDVISRSSNMLSEYTTSLNCSDTTLIDKTIRLELKNGEPAGFSYLTDTAMNDLFRRNNVWKRKLIHEDTLFHYLNIGERRFFINPLPNSKSNSIKSSTNYNGSDEVQFSRLCGEESDIIISENDRPALRKLIQNFAIYREYQLSQQDVDYELDQDETYILDPK